MIQIQIGKVNHADYADNIASAVVAQDNTVYGRVSASDMGFRPISAFEPGLMLKNI